MLAALLIAIAACGSADVTRPPLTNRPAIGGTWTQEDERPGAYRIINIFSHDTIVGGGGTYREVNGSPGNLTVNGFLRDTRVALDLAQDNGTVYHLNAALVTPEMMSGWLMTESDSVPVTFRYLPID